VYTKKVGVLEMPEGYEAVLEIQNKFRKKIVNAIKPWLFVGLGLLLLVFFLRKRRKNNAS